MSKKDRKEFKNRVRKLRKHVDALLELAPDSFETAEQRVRVDEILGELGEQVDTLRGHIEGLREEEPEPLVSQHERLGDRRDPRSVAN